MSDDHGAAPERDFSKMFDLNRRTLYTDLVNRMEECMRRQEAASDDLKELTAECHTEHELGPNDIAAMKKIAKLRLKDKKAAARDQLEALSRISKAVDFDLFDFAGI